MTLKPLLLGAIVGICCSVGFAENLNEHWIKHRALVYEDGMTTHAKLEKIVRMIGLSEAEEVARAVSAIEKPTSEALAWANALISNANLVASPDEVVAYTVYANAGGTRGFAGPELYDLRQVEYSGLARSAIRFGFPRAPMDQFTERILKNPAKELTPDDLDKIRGIVKETYIDHASSGSVYAFPLLEVYLNKIADVSFLADVWRGAPVGTRGLILRTLAFARSNALIDFGIARIKELDGNDLKPGKPLLSASIYFLQAHNGHPSVAPYLTELLEVNPGHFYPHLEKLLWAICRSGPGYNAGKLREGSTQLKYAQRFSRLSRIAGSDAESTESSSTLGMTDSFRDKH